MQPQRSAGRRPTQAERILRLLEQRGERGITALDLLSPTADGGPPVMRLPSRIDEMRRRGHRITATMVTTAGGARVARYRLVSPVPAASSDGIGGHADGMHEPLAFAIGGTVAHRPPNPYDFDAEGR